ncbi:35616_t:CDS:2, partial [Gigaspora margarita]
HNNTSSNESLSRDNIIMDLDMITDYSNETSDTDHSNKNNNPNRSNKKPNKKVPNGQQECEQLVKTQGSTSNFQTHLNTHGITKSAKIIDAIKQPTISEMFYHAAGQNVCQKESINYALVEWIVTNLQPFYVLKNESFIKLIHTLNPYYELPSDKYIKALIHPSYNHLMENLKLFLATEIKTCRLTCDLWTACSKSGYIDVTCHFINSNYELKEALLAIKYVPYPHDAVNIKAKLEEIINNWRIFEKVILITTDNAMNIIKAINLMGVERVPCMAHMLQLAIGKGLKLAEVLIKRTKRLINFLTMPKQNKQLRKAQKLVKILKKNIDNNEQEFFLAISDTPTPTMSADNDYNICKNAICLKFLMITEEEWKVLEELTVILAPFAEIIQLLEGSNYTILSFIWPAIITFTRNCMPLSMSISNEELDLTNMSTIFDKEEEEDIINVDKELEIIIMANGGKFKLSQPQNTDNLEEKSIKKLDSWKHDKAIDLLREKYNLLSIGNKSITSLVNVEQNENQMRLFNNVW